MLVVATASPFVTLVKIGQVEVLQKLFQIVTIPPAVADELQDASRPQLVRDFMASKPGWLSIRAPSKVESIPNLHKGESEAISLAQFTPSRWRM